VAVNDATDSNWVVSISSIWKLVVDALSRPAYGCPTETLIESKTLIVFWLPSFSPPRHIRNDSCLTNLLEVPCAPFCT